MLNLEQIEQAVSMVANSRLVEVDIQSGTQRLRIKNGQSATATSPLIGVAGTSSPLAQPVAPTPTLATAKPKQITSNYIGKVQLAADSVTPVFKNVGDSVAIGDTVAVVAQLGRLLPIKSEQTGVIAEVLVQNNQRVEYGTPLFVLS